MRLSGEPELFKINYTDTDKLALTNFKVEAFTVAGVMSYELEEKLKKLASDLQEGKHPLAEGEKDIKKVWVDEAQNILADYIPVPDMPPPRYLNTNLRTAMQSSYHAAQYIRLQDDSIKDIYPAYQYKTLADNRVREEHRRLHDTIWRNTDPVWDKIWPPNGWNCRCYIKPLNQDEVNSSVVQPQNLTEEQVNMILEEGNIPKDFQRNAGKKMSIWGGWLNSKMKSLPKDAVSQIIQHPYGWSENFPDVLIHTNVSKLKNHPSYKEAKGGDSDAAILLVNDLVKVKKIQAIKEDYTDAIVVPIRAVEVSGNNQIPEAYAKYISKLNKWQLDENIYQTNKTFHTGSSAIHRLFSKPTFNGEVVKDKTYIIVDDVTTSGSSLRYMKEYIESKGGKVKLASTLATSSDAATGYGGYLALKPGTKILLENKFDIVELNKTLKDYGIAEDYRQLSNGQATYLLTFKNADSIRARFAKERL